MDQRPLDQHDRLGVADLAAVDHRGGPVEADFQHFDILVLAVQPAAIGGTFTGIDLRLDLLGRRDGVVVQDVGWTEMFGWNDDNETIAPVAARESIENVARVSRT